MFNDKTTIPVGILSIKAIENLPANRAINFNGGLCGLGEKILGVTTKSWKVGEIASICFSGIAVVETNSAISTIGSEIIADSQGKVKFSTVATQGIYSLDKSAGAGKFVRVKL